MADKWTVAKRSEVMAKVKGRGNLSTELRLVAMLRLAEITGWRRHGDLPGKPDFVFYRSRTVVFVDGDFWHGNPKEKAPQTNIEFWRQKIEANKRRDRKVNRLLRARGWTVVRVWENDLRKKPHLIMRKLQRALARAAKSKPSSPRIRKKP